MDTMSVKQAAARLAVAEKTIFRYLASGKLSSTKIGAQHYIPTAQVERLALSRHVPTDEKTRLDNRVNTLYELFQAHDFRIKELEEKLAKLQASGHVETTLSETREKPATITPSHTTPQRQKATPAQSHTQKSAPTQPPDTLTLAELSARVGRNEKTILGHLLKWDRAPEKYPQFEHIKIPVASRPGTYSRYFSTSQAEEIASWIQQHARHV